VVTGQLLKDQSTFYGEFTAKKDKTAYQEIEYVLPPGESVAAVRLWRLVATYEAPHKQP
jgi:hypothetical protein